MQRDNSFRAPLDVGRNRIFASSEKLGAAVRCNWQNAASGLRSAVNNLAEFKQLQPRGEHGRAESREHRSGGFEAGRQNHKESAF
jgi:hypothetical protein